MNLHTHWPLVFPIALELRFSGRYEILLSEMFLSVKGVNSASRKGTMWKTLIRRHEWFNFICVNIGYPDQTRHLKCSSWKWESTQVKNRRTSLTFSSFGSCGVRRWQKEKLRKSSYRQNPASSLYFVSQMNRSISIANHYADGCLIQKVRDPIWSIWILGDA